MQMKLLSKILEYFKRPNDIIVDISDVRAIGIRHKEGIFYNEEIVRDNFSFDKIQLPNGAHTDYKSLVKKIVKSAPSAPSRFFRPKIFITEPANFNEKSREITNDAAIGAGARGIWLINSDMTSVLFGTGLFDFNKSFLDFQRGMFVYSDFSTTVFGIYFLDCIFEVNTVNETLNDIEENTFLIEIDKLKNSKSDLPTQFENLTTEEKEDLKFSWSKPLKETISIVAATKISFDTKNYQIDLYEDYPFIISKGCEYFIDYLAYIELRKKKKLDEIDNFFLRYYEKHQIIKHEKILNDSALSFLFVLTVLQVFCAGIYGGILLFSYGIFLGKDIWFNGTFLLMGLVVAKFSELFVMQIEIFVLIFKRWKKIFKK